MIVKSWLRSLIPSLFLLIPALSVAQVDVSVNIAPPALPVYEQPPIPGDGYLWTPGYWAWSDDDQGYFWVPGTWVEAPQPDYLWTPGYWGAEGAVFLWHAGYWGPQVGFYGGVNYGYGYGGHGYEGGYWQGGHLYYNRAVVNVGSTHITNVYNKTVINNVTVNRVSYNGGSGGVRAAPNAAELAAGRERHIEVTSSQREHEQAARNNPQLKASENHGSPPVAATSHPGNFSGAGVVGARGAGGGATRTLPASPHREQATERPAVSRESPPQRAPAPTQPQRPESQRPEQPRAVQQPHPQPQPREAPKPESHPEQRPPEKRDDHEQH